MPARCWSAIRSTDEQREEGYAMMLRRKDVFGLVSVLPNDRSAEGDRTIVVFSGLTSAGTHAAAAFLTSNINLRDLAERFRREGVPGWPRAFQVIVRCRASDDVQLLSYSYETYDVRAATEIGTMATAAGANDRAGQRGGNT